MITNTFNEEFLKFINMVLNQNSQKVKFESWVHSNEKMHHSFTHCCLKQPSSTVHNKDILENS